MHVIFQRMLFRDSPVPEFWAFFMLCVSCWCTSGIRQYKQRSCNCRSSFSPRRPKKLDLTLLPQFPRTCSCAESWVRDDTVWLQAALMQICLNDVHFSGMLRISRPQDHVKRNVSARGGGWRGPLTRFYARIQRGDNRIYPVLGSLPQGKCVYLVTLI